MNTYPRVLLAVLNEASKGTPRLADSFRSCFYDYQQERFAPRLDFLERAIELDKILGPAIDAWLESLGYKKEAL